MEVEATSLMSTLQGAAGNGPRLLSILSRAERAVSGRELCAVYRTALESYGQAEDEAYREICCRYMARLCESDVNEAREFHNRQRAFGITSDARMYEARALLEEREGEDVKAMKILQEGIRVGARPSDLLRRQLARLQREATPRRADTDQATQTAVPPVPRPSPALLAGWQRLRRVWRLTDALAAWKELRDAARQQRHTELFEALRQQLLLAERRCRGQGRGWQRLALRAWRCATRLGQKRQCLADVAYQEEMRRRASRVLLAWRCTREPRQKEPEELPMLESLLMDLQPPRAILGAQNGRSPREEDQKRPLRGPERFFYDTSSYTGCARYGGPMIVEKKENLGCQRRQSKTGRPEKNA